MTAPVVAPRTAPDGAPHRDDAETRVTVLLPLRNYDPRYLREAIGSVLTQSCSRWRMLIIVEPEDFARLGVVVSFALDDSRVRLIENRGRKLAGAFNTGMRAASTDFVAILLGDDMWLPHAVETLEASMLAHPDADLFHSARQIVNGEGSPISSVHYPPDHVGFDDFVWRTPAKHLLCWRRQKALSFGGMDETLNSVGPDDYDFPWMMLEHGAKFRAIPECLYTYRDHRAGYRLTTHIPRSVHLRELRRILTKHGVKQHVIRLRLRGAKRGFLRQCLYRNDLHRWVLDAIGFDPESGWRMHYR